MSKYTRASAFFPKEISEVLRQPRLILTLVLGPFLIILLFGLGYQNDYPAVRVAYVIPPGNAFGQQLVGDMRELGAGLVNSGTFSGTDEALNSLGAREVDLVVVTPEDPSQAMSAKEQIPFQFYYNEVDPLQVDHLRYIAAVMVSVVNRHWVEQILAQGAAATPQNASPSIVAQPYVTQTESIALSSPTPAQFFAPAVIILLLQHLALTFGALSIVRERLLGSMDVFRVSPLTAGETLFGKYLSNYVFGAVIAVMLVALLVYGFGVPMKGSWALLGGGVAITLFASLGWGFVLSGLARTDSQAVQYSMMVLLASFFFSGFVLRLDTLSQPVRAISRILPATYGIAFARDNMLRGEGFNRLDLLAAAGLAVALMLLGWLLLRRALRRA